MSTNASREALVALARFGLGPRPGDLARVAGDPRGLLKAELQPDKALITLEPADAPVLTSTTTNIQVAFAAQEARKMARERMVAEAAQSAPGAMSGTAPSGAMSAQAAQPPRMQSDPPMMANAAKPAAGKPKPPEPQPEAKIFRAEALARFRKAAGADVGFVERLVAFWSNHFCVSVAKGDIVRVAAGSFEREAIQIGRAHV